MKKTLIAILALAGAVSAAAADSYTYSFGCEDWVTGSGKSILTLGQEIDLTKDWKLTMTMTINPSVGSNQWGTGLVAFGENPTAGTYGTNGLQLYVKLDGTVLYKGIANTAGIDCYFQAADGTGKLKLSQGTYTFAFFHTEGQTTYAIYDSKHALLSSVSTTTAPTGTVSKLSTSITSAQAGWTTPAGSFSDSVVPEQTTATLSLLALAGLAARRRRAFR